MCVCTYGVWIQWLRSDSGWEPHVCGTVMTAGVSVSMCKHQRGSCQTCWASEMTELCNRVSEGEGTKAFTTGTGESQPAVCICMHVSTVTHCTATLGLYGSRMDLGAAARRAESLSQLPEGSTCFTHGPCSLRVGSRMRPLTLPVPIRVLCVSVYNLYVQTQV